MLTYKSLIRNILGTKPPVFNMLTKKLYSVKADREERDIAKRIYGLYLIRVGQYHENNTVETVPFIALMPILKEQAAVYSKLITLIIKNPSKWEIIKKELKQPYTQVIQMALKNVEDYFTKKIILMIYDRDWAEGTPHSNQVMDFISKLKSD